MLLEHKIQKFFIENQLTLALAESCTGGMIASRLVQIPDSSLYFLGGIISYSNQSKEHCLHVKNQTLARFGAVSEQTAEEMALGAQASFGSDFAVATTGIAGPSGGSLDKPVGTVCFSIASKKSKIFSWRSQFEGDRSKIIDRASQEALLKLWDILQS